MRISLFGNQDLSFDSLPFRIRPALALRFPHISFEEDDPNNLDLPTEKDWIIIDTVQGINRVHLLSIEDIASPETRMTAHDYDLGSYLLLAKKILPDLTVHIIGLPMNYPEDQALEETVTLLSSLI